MAVKNDSCNTDAVEELVKKYAPEATLESNYGAELSFALPKASASNFGKLFHELESKQPELGIESCGASMTTLDNVFLKIAHGEYDDLPDEKPDEMDPVGSTNETDVTVLVNDPDRPPSRVRRTGYAHLWDQCSAMWYKRSRHFMRHRKTIIAQIVVPSFFMLLALIIATTVNTPIVEVEPCRRFDTSTYDSNPIYLSADNTGYDTQVRRLP